MVTAIARELAGFVWSIACITSEPAVSGSTATKLYDEVTSMDYEVTIEIEEGAQQIQQITPDTDRTERGRMR